MKRLFLLALLLPLLLIAGCGNKDLVLTIDLLSYADQEDLSTGYGPIAPGTPTTTAELLEADADLLQGIGDATKVKSAKLNVGADFVNTTGSATGSFQVFIAALGTPDPFASEPVADFPVALQPAHTTTIDEEIAVTPEQLDALLTDEAWFAIRVTYNTQGSAEDLQGTVTLTKLTAILVTESDL